MTEVNAGELLAELVRCPSVNPGDRESFSCPYGEARLVSLLADRLSAWGADVTVADVYPGRPNLVARFHGRDRSKTILFDAHTDTVSHLHMAIEPFAAEIRDGRLFGRGACDTKGPMTAMLIALQAVAAKKGPKYDVIFAATCNEENGATGARHLAESGLEADFALIAEPTGLQLVTSHKGVSRARVTTLGKAAHSSKPDGGINAIYSMLPIASALQSLAQELAMRPPDPVLGLPTLAITTIEGGTAVNIIPDRCSLHVDRRILPNERTFEVKAEIEAAVHSAADGPHTPELTIAWPYFYPPMKPAEENDGLLTLQEIVHSVTGSSQLRAAPYGTNGGFYAASGIPCTVFGPGDIAEAHTECESISLKQVETAAEILERFLVQDWHPATAG